MRTIYGLSVLVCLALGAFPPAVTAQGTQLLPLDARSLALGGAYTAVAQGPTAVWWNPGALGIQPGLELLPWSSRNFEARFSGTEPEHFGSAAACDLGALGVGVLATHLEGGAVEETSWYLGLGTDLMQALTPRPTHVAWGLGAAFKTTESLFADNFGNAQDRAWDVDLGTLVKVDFPISLEGNQHGKITGSLGVTMHSIFANDLEFGSGAAVELPRTLRFGMAMDARLKEVRPGRHELGVLLAIDVEHLRGKIQDVDPRIAYAMEVRVWDIAALRVGIVDTSSPFSSSSELEMGFGLGTGPVRVGEQLFRIDFDLASLEANGRDEQISLRGAWEF